MSGGGGVAGADGFAIGQDLEAVDGRFKSCVEVPDKAGLHLFFRLVERDVPNGFWRMGNFGILRFFLFHLYLKTGGHKLLHPQCGGIGVGGGLHAGQQQRCLA